MTHLAQHPGILRLTDEAQSSFQQTADQVSAGTLSTEKAIRQVAACIEADPYQIAFPEYLYTLQTSLFLDLASMERELGLIVPFCQFVKKDTSVNIEELLAPYQFNLFSFT